MENLLKNSLNPQTYHYLKYKTTWLQNLADTVDFPLDTINMIAAQLTCVVVAILFRKFLNKKSAPDFFGLNTSTFRHLFVTFFGFLIITFVFNLLSALELFILPVATFMIMRFFPNYCHYLALVFNMGYLRTRPFLGHFACLGLALLFEEVLGGSVTLYVVIMHLGGVFEDSFSLFFLKNHQNSSFFLNCLDFSLKIDLFELRTIIIDSHSKTTLY